MTPSPDFWLLIIAVACAVPYGGVIAVLLWCNSKNRVAWIIGAQMLLIWPWMFVMSSLQLLLVIPLMTVFVINGCDISKPLSTKAIYWAIGLTIAFMAIGILIAMLLESAAMAR